MCLPGTVEKVREQQPTVTRRTVLAGGGAAALAALMPGEALAHKQKRKRGRLKGKVVDLTHTFTRGLPGLHRERAVAPDADDDPGERLLQAGVDLRRALRHAHGRARALRRRRSPDAGARGERAGPADRRHRHRRAGGERPGRRGLRRRPDALRAQARADREGRARGDGLRLGGEGRRRRAFKGGARGRLPLPRLRRRRDRLPARAAQGGGDRRRHAEPRHGPSATFPVHVKWLGADNFGSRTSRTWTSSRHTARRRSSA